MTTPTASTVEKKILSTLRDLFASQKFQLFVLTHLGELVVVLIASKLGASPELVSQLLFGVLASAGINSAVVTRAHATVDAAVTSATIAAAKSNLGAEVKAEAIVAAKDAEQQAVAAVASAMSSKLVV